MKSLFMGNLSYQTYTQAHLGINNNNSYFLAVSPIPNTIQWIFPKTSGQREHPVYEDVKLGLKKSNSTSLNAVAILPRGEARNSWFFNDGAKPREYSGQPTLNTMSQFRQKKART